MLERLNRYLEGSEKGVYVFLIWSFIGAVIGAVVGVVGIAGGSDCISHVPSMDTVSAAFGRSCHCRAVPLASDAE